MPEHKRLPEIAEAPQRHDLPERALLAAMLDEAITTIRLREHHLARNAKAWIMSKEKYPFSFEWVCEELDLCPNEFRKAVKLLVSNA